MARPARTAAQDRMLDILTMRWDKWARTSTLVSQISKASVLSVAPGGASDGASLVVVRWRGVDIAAPYLSTYTPAAGNVVAVARTGSQLLILGRIVGTP